MNIVVVVDIYDMLTNGTVMTAYRFVKELKRKGHSVRVVGTGANGEDCYPVPERYIPIATPVARLQQIRYAYPETETLINAFSGADLVHFILPFKLEKKGRKIAEQMGIPCTAAFHLQPENITYNCGFGWSRLLPSLIYSGFRTRFYKHFGHIHCPSGFIADQLRAHGYKAKLHVISNGVDRDFSPAETRRPFAPIEETDEFRILMIGRYAKEKRQDVLIKAIAQSKYADRIRLTLAGRGPRCKKLRKLAAKYLKNPVTMGFYPKEDLIRTIRESDLYVHAADVEIEAISCIEAFACGLVPVIANSPKSATPQFAIDERSLFKAGSVKDLAAKIDYWIEHPDDRAAQSDAYIAQGKRYGIEYSIEKAEEMFSEAIADHRASQKYSAKERRLHRRKFGKQNVVARVFSWLIYYVFAVPLLWVFNKFAYGLRIKGRKNLRKVRRSGAVSVSNHVHIMDAAFNANALMPHKVVFTALEANFRMPMAGFWVRTLGARPVPEEIREMPAFFDGMKYYLKKGRIVHFYPEKHLINYYSGIRDFSRGAFAIACDAQVPVLPVVITWRKRKGLYRLFNRSRPCATLTVCEPLQPDYILMKREMETDLMNRCHTAMVRAYLDDSHEDRIDWYAEHGIEPTEYRTGENLGNLS